MGSCLSQTAFPPNSKLIGLWALNEESLTLAAGTGFNRYEKK